MVVYVTCHVRGLGLDVLVVVLHEALWVTAFGVWSDAIQDIVCRVHCLTYHIKPLMTSDASS